MFSRAITFFIDLLAPRRCLCCGVFDTWLCDLCAKSLTRTPDQVCHFCREIPTPHGNLCGTCRGASSLRSTFVTTRQRHQNKDLLKKIITHYKYHFIKELSEPLGNIMAHSAQNASLPVPDMIIPVPLHARRFRWRGFNQSALLAQEVSKKMTPLMPILYADNILIRIRHTTPQTKTKNREQRLNSLKNAFRVNCPTDIAGKKILLIDDVATTGSTLAECASALKASGASSVDAMVLSRG